LDRAKRILLYSYALTAALGAIVGALVATDDLSHGLTLLLGSISGMAVCGAAVWRALADDLPDSFARRSHDRSV
jgi:hypothetical protein